MPLLPLVLPKQAHPVLKGQPALFDDTWYLFLQVAQLYASTGAGLVQYGGRAARLEAEIDGLTDGTLWVETDTDLVYQWQAPALAWVYLSGTYALTQAQLAAFAGTLGKHDTDLLVNVTDYAHILQWTGTGWNWGPGETGSGRLEAFAVAPTGHGWHLCDGSTGVSYLKSDGTTGTLTLPNTNGSAAYMNLGSAYNPAITAAAVPTSSTPTSSTPTFTGTPGTTGAASAGIQSSGATGNTLTQASHTHNITPAGTVSTPVISTPVISLPGDPVANFAALLYFRQ